MTMEIIFNFAGRTNSMEISPDIFDNTEAAFAAKSNAALQKAKWLFQMVGSNHLVRIGSSLANLSLALHLPITPLFRWTVYDHFCGGETFDECKKTIQQLNSSGVGVLLNYGVELKETEEDFDLTVSKNIEALVFGGGNKAVKGLCVKLTGFGRLALFEKVQSGTQLSKNEEKELDKVKKRLDKLCHAAHKHQVPLYVDAEESWIQDALDNLVEQMMEKYNREKFVVFNTIQLYRTDRLAYLRNQFEKAQADGYLLGVKLVRGAYMEKERERAAEMNYPSPIHVNKKAVDKDFDAAVNFCLEHTEKIYCCIASQSEESTLSAMKKIEKKKLARNHPNILFSQLYGMGDNITFNLARLGFNTTKYLPYGPVRDVIPYLIRRAQENTSVAGQTGRELSLIQEEIKRRRGTSC